MKERVKRAETRRMKGRYSGRLSNKRSGGRIRSFRAVPEYYRLAIESLKEYALITMDKNLIIASWSGPARVMFGYTEEEIIGKNISILFTPEDRAKDVDAREFASALKKGSEDDERWHVRKDGRRLWCYGLSFPLRDHQGDVRGFVKLIRNDTERKLQNDRARENEERIRLAAESTGLGTWDLDAKSKTLFLSERAAKLFGFASAAEKPCVAELLEKVAPEDRPRIGDWLVNCFTGDGRCDEMMEYRIIVPGEGVRWILSRARVFGAGECRLAKSARLIGTVVDITDQRREQSEARTRGEQLEAKVKDRTSLLSAVNRELETFAYSASHDLRAPIRKIAVFSEAIRRSGESTLSPKDQRYFDRIQAAAAKMERLIDDILRLARVTRKPLSDAEVDMTALAREIAGELLASDPARRVEFAIEPEIKAKGDRELLAIALRNLLDNAWKFTSKHDRARIEFGKTTVKGRTAYFVKDDGAGFDMQFGHKLFGAFQRLHSEEQFPGTGVGLGIVERVIRRHQGRLWADGRVERGATFYFTLHTEGV